MQFAGRPRLVLETGAGNRGVPCYPVSAATTGFLQPDVKSRQREGDNIYIYTSAVLHNADEVMQERFCAFASVTLVGRPGETRAAAALSTSLGLKV